MIRKQGLPEASDEFVEAFARGLAVIRAFGHSSRVMTLSEVAKRAELSPAGARRLLHTLVNLGYARVVSKRFELTPLVLELGFAYLSSLPLRDIARNVIDEFARETGEICTLSLLERNEVVYIVRAEVRSPLTRNMGIGERLPVHATSSGHILLCELEPHALEEILATAPFKRYTPYTRCEADQLRDAVKCARQNGWAMAIEELELGVGGLAVPVRDETDAIVAAVTVSVNLARYDQHALIQQFLPRLQEVAREIGRGLGNTR